MAGISESCSVCAAPFDVQFRYQMEERDGGFSFYCSQKCLEQSQLGGADAAAARPATPAPSASRPELVSQVLYVGGRRRYACSLDCRSQLLPRPAAPAWATSPAAAARADEEPPPPAILAAAAPQGAPAAPAAARPTAATAAASRKASSPAVAVPRAPRRRQARTGARAPGRPRACRATSPSSTTRAAPARRPPPSASPPASRPGASKVLLVDTDSQGNVGVSLGVEGGAVALPRARHGPPRRGRRPCRCGPNLDLLALERDPRRRRALPRRPAEPRPRPPRPARLGRRRLRLVVLDCSPSLSLMNQNALVFADSILVPVACDFLSLVGVRQVIKTVKNVNALLHHPVQICGVLPTFYDARASICRDAVEHAQGALRRARASPPIRAAIKVKEAPAQGKTIFEYAAGLERRRGLRRGGADDPGEPRADGGQPAPPRRRRPSRASARAASPRQRPAREDAREDGA